MMTTLLLTAALAADPVGRSVVDRDGEPLPTGAVARCGSRLLRHEGAVAEIVVSPDASRVVSAAVDSVVIWDAVTGKARFRFLNPIGTIPPPESLAADGRTLAMLMPRTALRIIDALSGRDIHLWPVDPSDIAVAISPDGTTLAVLNQAGQIRLSETASGKHRLTLTGAPSPNPSIVFSPDGKHLAAPTDRSLCVWDVTTGRALDGFPGRLESGVFSVAFAHDGRELAIAGAQGGIRRFDPRTGAERDPIPTDRQIAALAYSPNGSNLATTGIAPLVRFDLSGQEKPVTATGPSGTAISYSAHGKLLAVGTGTGEIRLFDPATGRERLRPERHESWVLAVAFSRDGNNLITGGGDPTVRVWNAHTGSLRRRLDGHTAGITAVTAGPEGLVVAGADDGAVRGWDADGREVFRRLETLGPVRALALSLTGGPLYAASGRAVRVFDLAGERPIVELIGGDRERLSGLAVSGDGAWAATACGDGEVRLWPANGGGPRRMRVEYGEYYKLAASPEGQLIAAVHNRRVELYRAADGRAAGVIPGPPEELVVAAAFSPDGRLLATAGVARDIRSGRFTPGTVHVWEVATQQPVCAFDGGQGRILNVAFAPDGRFVASANEDSTALVWDITGRAGLTPPNLTDAGLAELWDNLAAENAATAYRAVWMLAAAPDRSVPFLAKRLNGPGTPTPSRIKRLLDDLDGPRFVTRERASIALEELGPAAIEPLRQHLQGEVSAEGRRRAEGVLAKLTADHPSPARLRRMRVEACLRAIGTPAATALLSRIDG